MSFSVYASDGLHIRAYEGKAVQVTTRRDLTDLQFAVLCAMWPTTPHMRDTLHIPFYSQPYTLSDWIVRDDKYHTFTVTATGRALSEEMFDWLRGLLSEEEALWNLTMVSSQDETWSFQEFGGECYDLFRVGTEWREIGFVIDPDVKWVCLITDQQGFKVVEQWDQDEYTTMVDEFETWSMEDNGDEG